MMEKPAPTIEAFCRSVGMTYDPAMLNWDTDEDHQFAREAFEKWRGFHNDAIESKGLETKEPVSRMSRQAANKQEQKADSMQR